VRRQSSSVGARLGLARREEDFMKMKQLLTGAALFALGVTGGATFHLALDRQARAQSGESTAQPIQHQGTDQKSAQGTKQENTAQPIQNQGTDQKSAQGTKQESTAEPETGTRGESGRAGPMRGADAGAKATEPEKGYTEPGKAEPPKGTGSKPESLRGPEGDSGKRDPIPSGSETASPTHRGSNPW
jgi:hypothetical protein